MRTSSVSIGILAVAAAAALAVVLWNSNDRDTVDESGEQESQKQQEGLTKKGAPVKLVVDDVPENQPDDASDEDPSRVPLAGEDRRDADSKLESASLVHARRLARAELDVPHDLQLTDEEWKELTDIHQRNEGEVMKWNQSVHNLGIKIVDERDTRGEYEERVVTSRGIGPTEPDREGQVVLRRWKRNKDKERVVRIFRINPGTSKELDLHKTSLDSAQESWRLAATSFLRKVMARTSSK